MYADDDALPYRMVRPTETVFPVAGAIAFFLGIPQPFTHKASIKSHVKLLTLSRDDYEAIKVCLYASPVDRLTGCVWLGVD